MHRPAHALSTAIGAALASLTLGGCGPALIGTGIAELPGGNTDPAPVVGGLVAVPQSAASTTRFEFTVDKEAWVSFSYSVNGVSDEQPIGAMSLLDAAGNRRVADGTIGDGGGMAPYWLFPAGNITVAWEHPQDLGRVEERGVTLTLKVASPGAGSISGFDSKPILVGATIGRQNGTATIGSIQAVTGDEGLVRVAFTHEDRGDNFDSTFFDIAWQATGPGGSTGWTTLPRDPASRFPTGVTVSVSPSAPVPGADVATTVAVDIDMLDPAVTPGGPGIAQFATLSYRLDWRERYDDGELPDATTEETVGPFSIGNAPELGRPELPTSPSFVVPISVRVENPSGFDAQLRFTGTYRYDDGIQPRQGPLTVLNGSSLLLAAGDTRIHFVAWNATRDLGLGLNRDVRNLQFEITLRASVDTTGVGTPLSVESATSAPRPLDTPPFVSFDTQLASEGPDRLAILRDPATESQQLFIQSFPDRAAAVSSEVYADQQFARIQIPNLQPYDAQQASGGISQLVPLPSRQPVAGSNDPIPNCVVFESAGAIRSLEFVEGRTNAAVVPVLGNTLRESASPDQSPISYCFGRTRGSILFNYGLTATDVRTEFITLTGDAMGNVTGRANYAPFARPIHPPYFVPLAGPEQERNWRYQIFAVDGEFDTNPNTKTFVLADKSCNHLSAGGARRGLLHLLTATDAGNSTLAFTEEAIPVSGLAFPAGSSIYVTRFSIARWQDPDTPAAPAGLLLTREYFDPTLGGIRFEALTISRTTTGSWAQQWAPLAADLSQQLNFDEFSVEKTFAEDLDRDGMADPIAAVASRGYIASLTGRRGFGQFRLRDGTFRYTISTDVAAPNFEAVLQDRATSGAQFRWTLNRNPNEPTVWEDPLSVRNWAATVPRPELELVIRDVSTGQTLATGALRDPNPIPLVNVYILANPKNTPREWRKAFAGDLAANAVGDPQPGCEFRGISLLDLVDVNGDLSLDLVYKLDRCIPSAGGAPTNFDQQFVYFASAASGVARRLTTSSNREIRTSRRPGFLDLDKDGRADLVSQGAVYKANAGGSFQTGASGFVGGSDGQYWLESILPPPATRTSSGGRARIDIVGFSNENGVPIRAKVDTILLGDDASGLAAERVTSRAISFDTISSAVKVRALRPVVTDPARIPANGLAKDFLAVLEEQGLTRLHRFEFDAVQGRYRRIGTLPPSVELMDDLAIARVGDLTGHSDLLHNETVQDAFVAEARPGGSVYWLAHEPTTRAYAPPVPVYTARPSESILALGAALVDANLFEDLTIVTRSDASSSTLYRVYLLRQTPGPARFTSAGEQDLALRFEVPQGGSEPIGWGVDHYRLGLANGALISPTETRILRPEWDAARGRTRLTFVRSPIQELSVTSTAAGIVTTDFNLDGIPEVVGGGNEIFRIQREN